MPQSSGFNSRNSELEGPLFDTSCRATRNNPFGKVRLNALVFNSLNASGELYRVIQACLRAATIAGESVCTDFVFDVLDNRGVALDIRFGLCNSLR
jgi:hypothetical protein